MTPALLPTLPLGQSLLLLAPIATLALAALAAARSTTPAWRLARGASSATLLLCLASAGMLLLAQPGQAWGLRLDAVGATVLLLVGFVGWHRLLTFFSERPAAQVAAHKKFIVGRLADGCMFAAAGLLYAAFGTLHIDQLMQAATQAPLLPVTAQIGTLLVVVAALLKTAQLPFHGWLIQVMEAPTPVSALLHAGVVNLGGFVLIRLAPLVAELPLAMDLLVVAGATTAVIAALVMTTRISIKVMLAWSTTAQMGFMVMQCGLGLWEMALLHLVAHSLYKAHCFLAAGGTVRQNQVRQLAPAAAPPSAGKLLLGALAALAMTAAAAFVWQATGVDSRATPALWVMGGILTLALVPLLQSTGQGAVGLLKLAGSAFFLAAIYLGLHAWLTTWASPAAQAPGVASAVRSCSLNSSAVVARLARTPIPVARAVKSRLGRVRSSMSLALGPASAPTRDNSMFSTAYDALLNKIVTTSRFSRAMVHHDCKVYMAEPSA